MASSTAFLEIRQEDIGKVIGKGGSRIKQIENDSYARLRVNKSGGSGQYVTVEVIGSQQAIDSAKRFIGDVAYYRLRESNQNESFTSARDHDGAYRDRGFRQDAERRDERSSRLDNVRPTGWGRSSWNTDAEASRSGAAAQTSRMQVGDSAGQSERPSAVKMGEGRSEAVDEERWDDDPSTWESKRNQAEPLLQTDLPAQPRENVGWGGGWTAPKDPSGNCKESCDGFPGERQNAGCTTGVSQQRSGWASHNQSRKRDRDMYNSSGESDDSFGCESDSSKKLMGESTFNAPSASTGLSWTALRAEMHERAAAKWAELPSIVRKFYIEDPEVSAMTPEEVDAFRRENNNLMVQDLATDGDRKRLIPSPVRKFSQAFAHHPDLLDAVLRLRFEKPSPIQAQAWPILLSGHDLIGIAQTGTGKTLAFLLPAFVHIEGQLTPRDERRREGPSALVLTPTRELAMQIDEEVRKLNYHGMRCCCVYGGGSRKQQVDVCTRGVDFVVATPGRLDDLMMSKVVSLRHVTYLVLDEADRMLDLGFEPQINKILLDIRSDRQTIMTSATWPPNVRRLAGKYTKDPIQVFVGSLDLQACVNVRQLIEILDVSQKRERLIRFLRTELNPSRDKVIVFVDRKVTVDDLGSDLALLGIACDTIHGDRVQSAREQALTDFRTGATRVLLATDVASRGLDIRDVTHVLNYSLPKNMEDYVHRVGRTGRAGRFGTAITFVTRDDWRQAAELVRILEQAQQSVPRDLRDMASRYDEMLERRKLERPSFGNRERSYHH